MAEHNVGRDMVLAAAQAAHDISVAMLLAAGEAMTRHGNDPNSSAILGTAFQLTVERITENIDPNFKRQLIKALTL